MNVDEFQDFSKLKEKLREIKKEQFVNLIVGENFVYYYLLWEDLADVKSINNNFGLLNQRLTDIKKMLQKRIEDLRIYNENFSIKLAERIEVLEKDFLVKCLEGLNQGLLREKEKREEVEKINDNETIFTEIETNKFIAVFKDANDIANWAQMEALLDDTSYEFKKRANK